MNTNITGCRYFVAAQNLKQSVDFYKSKLGFQTLWADEGLHALIRDHIKIMLGGCLDDLPAFKRVAIPILHILKSTISMFYIRNISRNRFAY